MNTFLENLAIILNTFLEIFFIVVLLLFYYVLLGNVLLPCLAYFKKINGSVSLLMPEMVFLLLMVILSFGINNRFNIGPLKILLFGIISILISYVLMYVFGWFFYYLTKIKERNKKSDDKF